jgi:phenylalanine-4-hydroxylase
MATATYQTDPDGGPFFTRSTNPFLPIAGPGAAEVRALRYAPRVETHPATGDVDRTRAHTDTPRAIPDYLQPFIVEQDTSRYTAVDQAVWRFVLLQLYDRLGRTAHSSYARGLAQSAISPDRIPSIGEMDRGLASIGWGAVCVDGFIPPRAFQAFQSLGILPIAAEIRTPEHLPYTPAPDIIHEAAGHAPILIDPVYAAYVRAVGEVGARAFASPADARIDRAVRLLSELKETPIDDASLRAAEIELERAVIELGTPSEAARIARLYWWTAEYGLVGTPDDYRLFGAGLLSSLGESHFCHGPRVKKLPLSPSCTSVGYDITRPQPQLFVARDFEHLHAVLAEVSQTLAYDIGGQYAVQAALESGELCTLYFPGGSQVIGRLTQAEPGDSPCLLTFAPGAAIARRGQLLGRVDGEYVVPVGKLADGTDPRRLFGAATTDADGLLAVEYASGLRVSGKPMDGPWALPDTGLWLRELRLEWRGRAWTHAAPYPWLLAERAVTAGAGSASADVSPLGPGPGLAPGRVRARVPKSKSLSPSALRLQRLYADASAARRQAARAPLDTVHGTLVASYPHEWLLRWNLLETLLDLGLSNDPLTLQLERRLRELEDHYGGRHPIALGLDYLRAHRSAPLEEATMPTD